jgi:branched-subunit amino acid transport protein
VSTVWLVVLLGGLATVCFKAAGPVLLGLRPLPPRALGVVALVAPVMLAALVVVQAVGGDRELDVDGARLAGLAAGAVALLRGASLLVVMVVAAAVAAALRLAL